MAEISNFNIYKGILTSYPLRTAIFGSLLISCGFMGALWALAELSDFPGIYKLDNNKIRGFGAMIICIAVVLTVGVMSLSLVFQKRVVLKIEFQNGEKEVFSLNTLRKTRKFNDFIDFLARKYPPSILKIESKILRGHFG